MFAFIQGITSWNLANPKNHTKQHKQWVKQHQGLSSLPLAVLTPRQHPCSYTGSCFPYHNQQTQPNLLDQEWSGERTGTAQKLTCKVRPGASAGTSLHKSFPRPRTGLQQEARPCRAGLPQEPRPPSPHLHLPGLGEPHGGMHPSTPPRPRPTPAAPARQAPSQPARVTREQGKPQESGPGKSDRNAKHCGSYEPPAIIIYSGKTTDTAERGRTCCEARTGKTTASRRVPAARAEPHPGEAGIFQRVHTR